MPIFKFVCTECSTPRAFVRKLKDIPKDPTCKNCGGVLERVVGAPGLSVIEELDNGIMSRRVTRYADAERVWEEARKIHRKDEE